MIGRPFDYQFFLLVIYANPSFLLQMSHCLDLEKAFFGWSRLNIGFVYIKFISLSFLLRDILDLVYPPLADILEYQ